MFCVNFTLSPLKDTGMRNLMVTLREAPIMPVTIASKYCHNSINLVSQIIHAKTGLQVDQGLPGKELVCKINSDCVDTDLNQYWSKFIDFKMSMKYLWDVAHISTYTKHDSCPWNCNSSEISVATTRCFFRIVLTSMDLAVISKAAASYIKFSQLGYL